MKLDRNQVKSRPPRDERRSLDRSLHRSLIVGGVPMATLMPVFKYVGGTILAVSLGYFSATCPRHQLPDHRPYGSVRACKLAR